MIIWTWILPFLQLLTSVSPVLAGSYVAVDGPSTTEIVVLEIPDGQIKSLTLRSLEHRYSRPLTLRGMRYFMWDRSTEYIGVPNHRAPITELFGTVKPVTTTNSAGSTITGLAEAATNQGSIMSLIPVSLIPILSHAFKTLDANNNSVVNLGRIFTRENGIFSTAVILSGISTSCLTTVKSRGSTVFETVGLLTRPNGSVATHALAFMTDSASLALSTPATTESSPTASTATSFNSATGASRTRNVSRAASMNETARSHSTSVKPVISALSSSKNSNSLPNAQKSSFLSSDQTNSSRPVDTPGAAMVYIKSAALSLSFQLLSTDKALATPASQSTSTTGISTLRFISTSPNAQRDLSRSHAANAIVSATGLLSPSGMTAISRIGQGNLSPSTTTGTNSNNNTVGNLLLLVAQSDAALAKELTVALVGQQVPTITTVPSGMVVQSIVASTKCSHAFAMATTTSSDSNTITVIPRICHDDAAFLLFAGAAIPQLYKVALSLLGFLLRWICDPKSEALIGVDDIISDPNPGADSAEGTISHPNDDPQSDNGELTDSRGSTDRTFSTVSFSTNHPSFTITASASSAVTSPYYPFSGVGDEDAISDLLGELNPKHKAFQPAVGSTSMSRADWANLNLTSNEVVNLSLNSDVLLLAPYISLAESTTMTGNEFTKSASFNTMPSYPPATSYTTSTSSASSETSSPSGFSKAIFRRHTPDHQSLEEESSPHEHNTSERELPAKRDPGLNILAQYDVDQMPCPRDLAVISWAPNVPAVSNYPYMFLESQGEGTWIFLVSTGIESGHVVSRKLPCCQLRV